MSLSTSSRGFEDYISKHSFALDLPFGQNFADMRMIWPANVPLWQDISDIPCHSDFQILGETDTLPYKTPTLSLAQPAQC